MSEHNKNNPESIVPALLTIADVTERLQISRTTLFELTKSGSIKSLKIGASVRYTPVDINNYIKGVRPKIV